MKVFGGQVAVVEVRVVAAEAATAMVAANTDPDAD